MMKKSCIALAVTIGILSLSCGNKSTTSSSPTPSGPSIANGASIESTSDTLKWSSSAGSSATYNILMGTQKDSLVKVDSGLTAPRYFASGLSVGGAYYWQVVVVEANGTKVAGPVWNFFVTVGTVTSANGKQAMRLIPGGTFPMGCDSLQDQYGQPVHTVTVSTFLIDTTEVTQKDFAALLGGVNPSVNNASNLNPVDNITWFDAVLYCNARSKRDGLDTFYTYDSLIDPNGNPGGTPGNGISSLGDITFNMNNGYRLPTEAEWEYAADGGVYNQLFYWGDTNNLAYDWDVADANGTSHPVATKIPNNYQLYDMLGNIYEWVNDWFEQWPSTWPADSILVNPMGPATGSYRQMRGGSYLNTDEDIYTCDRDDYLTPSTQSSRNGFRVARSYP